MLDQRPFLFASHDEGGFPMADTNPRLAALIPYPHNDQTHDARTLELIADALRDVVVRRWEDPTDKPAERIAGAVIGE